MSLPADSSSQTLTFLFTDLESSTRLWELFPEAMQGALKRHDALLRAAVEEAGGRVIKTTGDGLSAVFTSVRDGVKACLEAQCSLLSEPWEETGPLRVRMGLHSGEAQPRGGDYYGSAVNRAARLMSAAHGGQVLLSAAAASLAVDLLPEGAALRDLGEHRLKDLERPEHIFQLVHPDLLADFPPLATLDDRPNNLPAQPTALIGREVELSEITRRLSGEEVRLLTLTGPGGTGKTRLALQAASELVDCFSDGVYFVDLAPVRDPAFVPAAVARAIGLRETSDRPLFEELKNKLHSKSMLLLLDNFEQVTEAAPVVVELLRDSPHLKMMVTSREALHVRSEYISPVPPLALPKLDHNKPSLDQLLQYEAVQLFIERAQAVKPDFKVTNENVRHIAEICSRLDGLPLAIELAAARIRLFSPQALLERLRSRLDLLRGGARDLPARQQALRSTIDWSYEILEASEQHLFALLSAFMGCTVEAVEQVASQVKLLEDAGIDVIDGMASLVDKSLLRQIEPESGEPRLVMLETIREYAAERLAQDPELSAAVHRAHATYFAAFTQRLYQHLTGPERNTAVEVLSSEIGNVGSAWNYWVKHRDLEQLGKIIDSLWLLYDLRGWYHGTIGLTTDLLKVLSETPSTPELAREEIVLRTSLARALWAIKGYTSEVEEAYTHALNLARSAGEIPQLFPVLRGLSAFYQMMGEFEKSAQLGEQILSLAGRLDDANMRVDGHLVHGTNLIFLGDIQRGLEQLEQGIGAFDPRRRPSSRFWLGTNPCVACHTVSGLVTFWLGFPDQALKRADDAVDLSKSLNHPYSMAYALFHNGFLHYWRREVELSREYAQAVLEIAERHEFLVWKAVASCLHGASMAWLGEGDQGLAELHRGTNLYQGLRTPPIFWPLLLYLQAGACLKGGKPEQGLALLQESMAVPGRGYDQILYGEGYRLGGELLLALGPENMAEAEDSFSTTLELGLKLESPMLELRAAVNLAKLWRDQGDPERGRRVLSGALAKMTEGFTTPDLLEARELLR